uniref:Uncharacterized protein n=1 Tax=Amphimedon queenslandica TaxID=400682 RepID=A0A1X7T1H6_AMPQE
MLYGAVSKVALDVLDELSETECSRKLSSVFDDSVLSVTSVKKAKGLQVLSEKVKNMRTELVDLNGNVLRINQNDGGSVPVMEPPLKMRKTTQPTVYDEIEQIIDNDDTDTVSVNIRYHSGSKSIDITSPFSKLNVKRLARRSLNSLACSVASEPRTSNVVLQQVSHCNTHEMKAICSSKHNSILRDCNEGVTQFNWDTVFVELA